MPVSDNIYLTGVSAGTNIDVAGITVSVEDPLSVNTLSASNAKILNNLTVDGNLTVNGNTTTLNTTELYVEDKLILLASGTLTAGSLDGSGIVFGQQSQDISIKYKNSTNHFSSSIGFESPQFSGSFIGDGSGLTGIIVSVPDPLSVSVLTASSVTGSTAKFVSVSASFSGSGDNLFNITSSNIKNFATDVTGLFSAGSGLSYLNGVYTNTGIVNLIAGDNIGVSSNTISLSSSLSNLTSVTASSVTGSDIKTTTLTASYISGSDAKYTSITASHAGNGSGLTNLTASQLTNFTADVVTQLSGGNGISYNKATGVITNSGIVSLVAGPNIGVLGNYISLSSSLTGLTSVSSTNFTGSDVKTTTLSASFVTGSDAKFTSISGSFNGDGANITSLNAGNISTGILPVARGGTGAASFTSASLLVGNNGNTFGTIAPAGNSGSALVSNGTNWIPVATSSIIANSLTITNAADNRVVTSTGGTGLNGESSLTFDGTQLAIASTGVVLQSGKISYEGMILSGTLPQDTSPAFILTTAKASSSKSAGDVQIIGGDGFNNTYTGSNIVIQQGYHTETPSNIYIGITGSVSAVATGDYAKIHIYNPICLSGTNIVSTSGGTYTINNKYPVVLFTGSSDSVGTMSSGVDMQLLKIINANTSSNTYIGFTTSTTNFYMPTSGSSGTPWSLLRLYQGQSAEMMYLSSISKWVVLNTTGLLA